MSTTLTSGTPWPHTKSATDGDQPIRRVARYDDLPTASRGLIDALVAKRLLVKDTRDGEVVVAGLDGFGACREGGLQGAPFSRNPNP